DRNVTGVQTCALPISTLLTANKPLPTLRSRSLNRKDESTGRSYGRHAKEHRQLMVARHRVEDANRAHGQDEQGRPEQFERSVTRSEERRVGKEWRSGW